MVDVVEGDAARDYINDPGAMILQINNCTACKLHTGSFAADLASVLPYSNPYKDRIPTHHYPNLAIFGNRPHPGTIQFKTSPSSSSSRPVICCLFAQFRMGGNGANFYYVNGKHTDPEYLRIQDCPKSRLKYFRKSMNNLKLALNNNEAWKNIDKIIIPFYIGCGLGGGNWIEYYGIIRKFAVEVTTSSRKIILVKKKKKNVTIRNNH